MTTRQPPLLALEQIVFSYPDAAPALRGVSAAIHRGERIAVLGNNGAGKSTFFLICNGILRPQQGTVYADGQPVSYTRRGLTALRRKVGIVFQDADNQIIASDVESEISFGPMNLRLPQEAVQQAVDEAIRQMGLGDYRRRAPQYLSGGEKKRVTIADILAMEPDVILLDEPTASLDPENVARLEETLDQLTRTGIALLVSTHDVDFAARFADRGLVFSHSKLLEDGPLTEIFAKPDLLREAGLRKPSFWQAAEAMAPGQPPYPMTLEAFTAWAAQRSGQSLP